MKIYLSGSYSRLKELRGYASLLREEGHVITARWLRETPAKDWFKASSREKAEIDVHDVRVSDILVRFSDSLSAPTVPSVLATGARHTEVGMALAWGIPVVVVGGHQNVFDYLEQIKHVRNLKSLIKHLSKSERKH